MSHSFPPVPAVCCVPKTRLSHPVRPQPLSASSSSVSTEATPPKPPRDQYRFESAHGAYNLVEAFNLRRVSAPDDRSALPNNHTITFLFCLLIYHTHLALQMTTIWVSDDGQSVLVRHSLFSECICWWNRSTDQWSRCSFSSVYMRALLEASYACHEVCNTACSFLIVDAHIVLFIFVFTGCWLVLVVGLHLGHPSNANFSCWCHDGFSVECSRVGSRFSMLSHIASVFSFLIPLDCVFCRATS